MKIIRLFFAVLFCSFASSYMKAQIKVNTNSMVALGYKGLSTSSRIQAQWDKSSGLARVFTAYYNSTATNPNAIAINGQAKPSPGYGFGAKLEGGEIGVNAQAILEGTGNRYGVYAQGLNGDDNYGVYAIASGNSANSTYGIYAIATGSATTKYAGYFSGDVTYTGTLTHSSDSVLKEDIQNISEENVLDQFEAINPISFNYKQSDEYERLQLAKGRRFGFTAQNVEKIFPNLVKNESVFLPVSDTSEIGNTNTQEEPQKVEYKGVNYIEFIPLLVQAVKDLYIENKRLTAILEKNGIN